VLLLPLRAFPIAEMERSPLWKAADVLQNKLTRAQYLDEVTWTTRSKNWLGLQKQRTSVVLHTAIAEQIVNELACVRLAGAGGCTELSASPPSRESLGGSRSVPVLVPVRASPVPSVVRGRVVNSFSSSNVARPFFCRRSFRGRRFLTRQSASVPSRRLGHET